MRRSLAVTVLALMALCATALAAGYGTGTFKGKVRGSGGRHSTNVTVKVLPGRARIKRIGLDLECGTDPDLPARVRVRGRGPYERVKEGLAGGGAVAKLKRTVEVGGDPYKVTGDVYLGIEANLVRGAVFANLRRGNSIVCTDATGTFTAHR
jgi:hypothetical protein